MLNNNDPRQFRDMSDNPTNTGWEDRDWDEIRPMFFIDEFEPEQEDEEDYPRNTYKENTVTIQCKDNWGCSNDVDK